MYVYVFIYIYVNHPWSDAHNKPLLIVYIFFSSLCVCVYARVCIYIDSYSYRSLITIIIIQIPNISILPKVSLYPFVILSSPVAPLTALTPGNHWSIFCHYIVVCIFWHLMYVWVVFFKFYLFIYLWLCWVFVSVRGLSLVAASGGHSSSRCMGLSLSRPLLLRRQAPDAQAQ